MQMWRQSTSTARREAVIEIGMPTVRESVTLQAILRPLSDSMVKTSLLNQFHWLIASHMFLLHADVTGCACPGTIAVMITRTFASGLLCLVGAF